LWYAVLNLAWLLVFNWVVHHFVQSHEVEDFWEAVNGLTATLVTAVFLGWALNRYVQEIRRAAGKLAENEACLRLVGDNLPDSYVYQFEQDAGGNPRFTYVSAGVERVHGLKADEVLRDATVLLGQMDVSQREAHAAAVAESARNLSDFRMELRVRRGDGSARVMLVQSRPRRTVAGGLVWDGFVTDVTEQKQVEIALQQSEERFRKLVETAPEAIFIRTKSWFTYVNGATLHLFGVESAGELLGQPVLDRFAPECRERVRERMLRVDEMGERTDSLEQLVLRKDGSTVGVIISAVPFFYRDQPSVLVFARDITARKRAECALRESERFAKSTLDSLSAHIAILDDSGSILAVNQAWRRFWSENDGVSEMSSGGVGANYLAACDQATGDDAETGRAFAAGIRSVLSGQELQFSLEYPCHSATEERWFLGRVTRFIGGEARRLVVEHENITARKRVENALRQSESKWRSYIEHAPVGILVADETGRHVEANRAAEEMLGYEPGGLLKTTVHDIPAPENGAALQRHFEEMTTTGYAAGQFLLRRQDGSSIWASVHASRMADGRMLGIFQNITEQKRAEAALRENEEQFRAMFDTALVGVVQTHPTTGQLRRVNRRMCEITGYSAEELMEMNVQGLVHPDDWPQDLALRQRLMHGESSRYHLEKRYVRKDGNPVWVAVNMTQIHDAEGQPTWTVATVEDITERRKAEEGHMRLSTALEQAAESIVITNLKGTILYVNPAFERISGYSRQEAVGRNTNVLNSGKHDAAFYQQLWATVERGEVWRGRFVNRRKDGTLYEEEATISPLRNASGKIDHYMAIKLDVTRERALERQFLQAQKLEAIGQLAGGVAHDFNNILTSILMQVELGHMLENVPEEVREGLHQIRSDAERAASLTRQLLLFSRRQVMQSRDVDLNEVVTNLAKMLQRIIGEDVRLQLHLHPTPLLAHADAGMLDQVAMNLAVNARDAMPTGGRLIIETSEANVDEPMAAMHAEATPGRYVCLSVSDTGCGIPADVLPRIFEPFYTTKEPGKGTGLGLATVFGIIKQHHGWITVKSEPGVGTTFKVFLPALASGAVPPKAEKPMETRGGSETLLLVEDDAFVRSSILKILTRKGYVVLEAASGDEALKVWAEHASEVALLLTDLVMPGSVNGRQLARRLRKQEPKLRVIYSSGYSAEIAGQEIKLSPGEHFMQKPINTAELLKTIRNCLDRKGG
jgi:PAS domain S-box-containing protein